MVLALFLALLAPLPREVRDEAKAAEAELAKFQGVWKATALESSGTTLPADRLGMTDRYNLGLAGDKYALGLHAGTLKVDPAKKSVDLTVTEGRYKGRTILGLYEIKDDTLKLVLTNPTQADAERPKELKTTREDRHLLYTFERQKATKEEVEAKVKELREFVANRTPGGFGVIGTPADRTTQDLLRQVIERLDRIEKRLDAMEKKASEKK